MSDTHLQATVGADRSNPGDGSSGAVRRGKEGGVLSSDITARYQQAVLGGNVYGSANQAGITSQAGLSVTTPALTVANPLNSGVRAVLWYAGASMSVACAAAAAVWLAVNTDVTDAPVTGTATTAHRNMLLGGSQNSKCNSFLAATLAEAPVALSLLGIGLTGAITVVTQAPMFERWYDGSVILQPGTSVSIQTSTASGTSGLWCEYIWEEFPV